MDAESQEQFRRGGPGLYGNYNNRIGSNVLSLSGEVRESGRIRTGVQSSRERVQSNKGGNKESGEIRESRNRNKVEYDEALAWAIGDKGETQQKANDILSFARLKSWLNDAWNWIKEKLGIDSKADIENMTLDDFSDKAVKDLTGGKELKVENDLGNKAKNNNFAENNIVNKNGEINYDELNRQTDKILNGTNRINALSLEEEHGRTRGGRRNVEATLLLRGSIGPDGSQQGNTREQQEKILKDYAQREGIWILPETIDTWRPIDDNITTEARVYFDGDNVIKVGYNYLNFYDMPLDWLTNKISLNNFLFPDTSLELIGFTETYGATREVPGVFFAPVYRQKYVKGHVLSESELPLLEEEMKRRGFKKIGYSNYFNENYVIGDLHTGNVIITEKGFT